MPVTFQVLRQRPFRFLQFLSHDHPWCSFVKNDNNDLLGLLPQIRCLALLIFGDQFPGSGNELFCPALHLVPGALGSSRPKLKLALATLFCTFCTRLGRRKPLLRSST